MTYKGVHRRISLRESLTSGRYDNTGSLHSNLARKTSRMVVDWTFFICCLASSCQAVMSVLLASSPWPHKDEIAVSESGSV
jgi:hypothetical protein